MPGLMRSQPSFAEGFARNASQSAYPNLWKGLEAYWAPSLGKQGMSLRDMRDSANTASLVNMTTASWVAGRKGQALAFNGAPNGTRITTPYTKQLGDFTAMAWFRADGAGYGSYERILDKNYTNGFVICRLSGAAHTWGAYALGLNPVMVTLTDALWHHITLTRVGSVFTVYGDGGRALASATIGSTALSTQALAIGWSDAPFNYNQFLGLIGDVAIYRRGLSSSEIAQVYAGASPLQLRERRVGARVGAIPRRISVPIRLGPRLFPVGG